MDSGLIAQIITILLIIIGAISTAALVKIQNVGKALKETADVFTAGHAVIDEGATKEEVERLKKEINEAQGAWKDVFMVDKS